MGRISNLMSATFLFIVVATTLTVTAAPLLQSIQLGETDYHRTGMTQQSSAIPEAPVNNDALSLQSSDYVSQIIAQL